MLYSSDRMLSLTLGTWDYVSLSALVVLSSVVGIYYMFTSDKSKNNRTFLVFNRDLGTIPLVLSSAASIVSAIIMLAYSSETYTNGSVFMLMSVAFLLVTPLGVFLYTPMFYKLGYTTVYQYLERRYNRSMRLSASTLCIIRKMLHTSVAIYAPALALNQVTGLHVWGSVAFIGAICIIYTSMGGFKAVVWADATQFVMIISGILFIVIKGCLDVGGIQEVWKINYAGRRSPEFIFSSPQDSAFSFWTVMIGGTFTMFNGLAADQLFMQRYMSTKNLKSAQISYAAGLVLVSGSVALCCFCGLVIYARYHNCDPKLSGLVKSRDQLMTLFAMDVLSFCDGLPGIFVAAILCATISTLSTTLNTIAALTMEDFIRPLRPNMAESEAKRLSKFISVLCGLICIGLVAMVQSLQGLVKIVFMIAGVTSAPILTLFTLGMLFPWITTKGSAIGILSGILLTSWASLGNLLTKPHYPTKPMDISGCSSIRTLFNVSQSSMLNNTLLASSILPKSDGNPLYSLPTMWYTSLSLAVGFTVGILASIITGVQNPEDVDPELIFPFVVAIIRKLPRKLLIQLGFHPETSRYFQITENEKNTISPHETLI